MLSALLLIFFGYIIYKVFMFKRRVDAVRDDLRRQFEEVGQQFGGATNAQPDHKQHEKRYRQTDGEYVDFEEVRGEAPIEEPQTKSDVDPGAKKHAHEELISDAEFEEIN